MDTASIMELTKARIGISTNVRDAYLTAIIEAVITELEDEKGITLYTDNANHIMFVVDYSTWRYQSRDSKTAMPRDLQFRLHNIIIHDGGKADVRS